MQEVLTERAQEMMVRLQQHGENGDPNGLYHEAAEVIADLAEAWTAAQEVIAALRNKLNQR